MDRSVLDGFAVRVLVPFHSFVPFCGPLDSDAPGTVAGFNGIGTGKTSLAVRNRTGLVCLCNKRRQSWATALCSVFVCLAVATAQQQQVTKISGVVSDPTGAAIPNASVEFDSKGSTVRTQTDRGGNFRLLSTQAYGTLSISSPGFATAKIEVSGAATEPLQIRLEPAATIERIIVNATRGFLRLISELIGLLSRRATFPFVSMDRARSSIRTSQRLRPIATQNR